MSTPSFTTTILVGHSPKEAFRAITNIRGWWSENIEGGTEKLNDEFLYRYEDVHYCKLKMIECVPDQKVVWLVLDNYFKFTKDKGEWKDTRLVFEISQKAGQTAIRFTHEGLVPQYECYEICREAWTEYIRESLYGLITTGKGNPNSKENDSFNAQLAEKWAIEQNS